MRARVAVLMKGHEAHCTRAGTSTLAAVDCSLSLSVQVGDYNTTLRPHSILYLISQLHLFLSIDTVK